MNDTQTAIADLEQIACRVDRLSPDRRDPERFYEYRSEIVAALRAVAREIAVRNAQTWSSKK